MSHYKIEITGILVPDPREDHGTVVDTIWYRLAELGVTNLLISTERLEGT